MKTGNSIKAFEWKRLHRLTARCLVVALAPLALDGCLSIGVDRSASKTPAADARCSLEARLYEKGKDVNRDVKSTREVTWKLFRHDGSPVVPVKEGKGAAWSATDLEAGKYRLAASWGPKPGVAGDTSAGSGDKSFTLAPGENGRADVVLSKFSPWGWIAIGVVVVGTVAALAAAFASDTKEAAGCALGGCQSVSTRQQPATAGRASGKKFVENTATN